MSKSNHMLFLQFIFRKLFSSIMYISILNLYWLHCNWARSTARFGPWPPLLAGQGTDGSNEQPHLGSGPVHSPVLWQVLVWFPSSWYPLAQAYVAVEFGVNPVTSTIPLSITIKNGHEIAPVHVLVCNKRNKKTEECRDGSGKNMSSRCKHGGDKTLKGFEIQCLYTFYSHPSASQSYRCYTYLSGKTMMQSNIPISLYLHVVPVVFAIAIPISFVGLWKILAHHRHYGMSVHVSLYQYPWQCILWHNTNYVEGVMVHFSGYIATKLCCSRPTCAFVSRCHYIQLYTAFVQVI